MSLPEIIPGRLGIVSIDVPRVTRLAEDPELSGESEPKIQLKGLDCIAIQKMVLKKRASSLPPAKA